MRLGIARTIKLTLASFFVQTSWSFTSLQQLGFLFTVEHGTHDKKQIEVIDSCKTTFNTHPYMASYIIGALLRLSEGEQVSIERIDRFVSVAQTSFASAGDLLFWHTIRPALLLGAVILGLKIGIVGPIAAFVVYNILHLFHRIRGFQEGYEQGTDVIYILRTRRFTLVQRAFEFLGAILTGGLLTLLTIDFQAWLFLPLCLLFIGLLFKRMASTIIVIIAIIITMAIVLV